MSQENVEICRRVAELLGGDNPTASLPAALEYCDPEIVFDSAIVSGAEEVPTGAMTGFARGKRR